MSQPDIALFLPSMEGGGARKIFANLSNYFSEQGYKIDLVLVNDTGSFLDEIPQKVSIFGFTASRMLTCLPELIAYLKKRRPKTLISTMFDANIISLLAKRLSPSLTTRFVIRVPTVLSEDLERSKAQEKYRIIPSIIKHLYPTADHIIAISNGVAKDLHDSFGITHSQITVVHNPIVTADIHDLANPVPEHEWFQGKNNEIILGVGRLTEQKDFATLIKAFSSVRRQRDTHLVILGEGHLKDDLISLRKKLQLEDYVDFLGFVDNPYKYMRYSDLFVLSSAWEGFGNVLPEAMACGTPVVSTDCPSGPSEILDQGTFGPLVPVGDAEQLAAEILNQLQSPTDSQKLRNRANEFSLESGGPRYTELLMK